MEQVWGVKLTGTGLCWELIEAGVGCAVNYSPATGL